MEILGKILGSPSRVKMMRLFLQNKSKAFTNKDIVSRSRVNLSVVRKELALLSSANFVKKMSAGWTFNLAFPYTTEFEDLLINAGSYDKQNIIESFRKSGKIKLLIVSGVFIKDKDTRADILVVGDKIKTKKVEEGVKRLEAEIGVELSYVVFDTKEFVYRLDMYDKLVRDILDFPHEVVWSAKELSTQALKRP
ncbi:MAG TPA: hypothetical protein VFQ59_01270 [Candidatus Paceibacterota bacterium]|nr:hypothetical protein [Candidatus Paceibacterota bacterium]